jgi:RimJ/RimL family protein N-acetyltransferase
MTDNTGPGPTVTGWAPPPLPGRLSLTGDYAALTPLDAGRDASDLFAAYDGHPALWDFLSIGPFSAQSAFHRWMRAAVEAEDRVYFAVRDRTNGRALGLCALMRIKPEMGTIEIGAIVFSPALQKSRVATEAIHLLMDWAVSAGYRRVEWKCDSRNIASRRAAQRLGFSYEGVFRQHMVVKGRNRDTAWFAITDGDWPALREAFRVWLAPANFDASGRQKERLSDLTRLVRVAGDPVLRRRE